MTSNISQRIKEAIEKSGYTLIKLQEITGIPKSAIQRYASGDTDKLPIDRVKKIAIATNVSPAYLMGWDDDDKMLEGIEKKNDFSLNFNLNSKFSFYNLDLKKIVYSGIFDSYRKYNNEYYKWYYDISNKFHSYVEIIEKAIDFTKKNNLPMLTIDKEYFNNLSFDFLYYIEHQRDGIDELFNYLDELSIMDSKKIEELYIELENPLDKKQILEKEYNSYNFKNLSIDDIDKYYERYLEVVKLEKNKFEICIGVNNKEK